MLVLAVKWVLNQCKAGLLDSRTNGKLSSIFSSWSAACSLARSTSSIMVAFLTSSLMRSGEWLGVWSAQLFDQTPIINYTNVHVVLSITNLSAFLPIPI